ncbi:MAG: SpoIID/LytB domain-containing protein [Synechococcaceae cyanobacterium]|nr:SpoIID/LytB domain-containing protein [Synechococcaceae cyanobacterium]
MAIPSCPRPPVAALQPWLGGLLLLSAGGCRAVDFPPPPAAAAPLHWPVPKAAALDPVDPVLWVGLAARLGPGGGNAAAAAPLRLSSGGGMLTLVDADGQRFMAPDLTLHWRWRELPEPLRLRRRVLAPFASFESAEEAAERWREQGVAAVIAKPADWEVWAPADASPPSGASARLVERSESRALALELRRAEGVVPLRGPIRIEAPGGLRWKGGLYAGPFRLQHDAHGGWSLVEQVPLERYLEGVVPHEIGAGSPPAALAAQAVLARTWAVRNRHRFAVDGYHLCADTQCQVYSDPRQAGGTVRRAIAASHHKVLASAGQPIHAVYHATNGGIAAGFEEVWSGRPLPYLRAFPDGPADFASRFAVPLPVGSLATLLREGQSAFGSDHPLFRWQRVLSAGEVARALGGDAAAVGQPRELRVVERGPSGRVLALEIRGSAGTRVLRLDAIRRTLRQLPSTLFSLSPAGEGSWRVEGGGFGHGAGLSQAGAIDLARRGWSSERILQHYYPGTVLLPLRSLTEAP